MFALSSETQTRWDGNLIIIIVQGLISTCGRLCFSEFQHFPSQALRKRQMLPRAAFVKTLPHQPLPDPRAAVWWSSSAPCWPPTGNRPSVGDTIGRGPRPRAKVSPGEAGPALAELSFSVGFALGGLGAFHDCSWVAPILHMRVARGGGSQSCRGSRGLAAYFLLSPSPLPQLRGTSSHSPLTPKHCWVSSSLARWEWLLFFIQPEGGA